MIRFTLGIVADGLGRSLLEALEVIQVTRAPTEAVIREEGKESE